MPTPTLICKKISMDIIIDISMDITLVEYPSIHFDDPPNSLTTHPPCPKTLRLWQDGMDGVKQRGRQHCSTHSSLVLRF